MIETILNHLLVLSGVLGTLGVAYLAWLLSGVGNMGIKKSLKDWSWARTGEDLLKAVCFAGSMVACSVVSDVLAYFIEKLQIAELNNFMTVVSWGVIVAIPIIGALYLLYRALKNNKSIIGYDEAAKAIGVEDGVTVVDNSKEIAESIRNFVETITQKSDKEDLAENGVDLAGEELTEEEIGKGGLENTYPEPYRSAPKDSMTDPSTCYNRECVSYTAWKICELKGSWPPRTGAMSAKYWIDRLPSWGYKEVVTPQNGGKYVGIATGGQYGHSVWFEFDNTVTEYNYASAGNWGARQVRLSDYRWFEIQAPDTPTPTPTEAFNVGDTVTLKSWVDYNGKALKKTREYYFISQISGDRAVLNADSVSGAIYAAVNMNNLTKVNAVQPTPEPTPAPTPVPTEIIEGDSVYAWGRGAATSLGTGAKTKDFPRTRMKVIMVVNGRYALNQYNRGNVGNASAVTGWWAKDQIEKA